MNGGTVIDDVIGVMDVMEDIGAGFDMSVDGLSNEGEWYLKNLDTGQVTGPFSTSETAHKTVKMLKGMGGKYKVVHKKKRRRERKLRHLSFIISGCRFKPGQDSYSGIGFFQISFYIQGILFVFVIIPVISVIPVRQGYGRCSEQL